jgi:hypothetical protein
MALGKSPQRRSPMTWHNGHGAADSLTRDHHFEPVII